MAESSTDKPTLEVGIIAVLTIIGNNVLPTEQHVTYTTLVSPIGWALGWGIRWIRRRHNHRQLMKAERKWILEREVERDKPGLSNAKKKDIERDIIQRRATMEKMERDRWKIE